MTGTRGDTMTAVPEVTALLRAVRALPPWERIVGAGCIITDLRSGMAAMSEVRTAAVEELRAQGLTYREIGELIGVHEDRVIQIGRRRKHIGWSQVVAPEVAAARGDGRG